MAKASPTPKAPQPSTLSLSEFARVKRRPVDCRVCALPAAILEELEGAAGIPWPVRVEWLQRERGFDITLGEARTHSSGRHTERYAPRAAS